LLWTPRFWSFTRLLLTELLNSSRFEPRTVTVPLMASSLSIGFFSLPPKTVPQSLLREPDSPELPLDEESSVQPVERISAAARKRELT